MQGIQVMWVQSLGPEDPLGNGNPLQYSCLENSMNRRDWWAPWGNKESDSDEHACTTQWFFARQLLESPGVLYKP